MGIYSDVALVMNAKGMECLNAQLEKLDRDMRDDVLEFLDWADEEAETASGRRRSCTSTTSPSSRVSGTTSPSGTKTSTGRGACAR